MGGVSGIISHHSTAPSQRGRAEPAQHGRMRVQGGLGGVGKEGASGPSRLEAGAWLTPGLMG